MALREVTELKPKGPGKAFEKHYTCRELAEMWHIAEATVRTEVGREPDIIRFGRATLRGGKQRRYLSLRVPESVAERVYRRLTRTA